MKAQSVLVSLVQTHPSLSLSISLLDDTLCKSTSPVLKCIKSHSDDVK